MKALAELLVSFLELLEEEGRTLREKTVRLFLAIVIFFIAAALAVTGLVLIVVGVFHFLTPLIGKTAAYFVLGGVSLLAAFFLFSRGGKIAKS